MESFIIWGCVSILLFILLKNIGAYGK